MTASPAEPGDLPCWFSQPRERASQGCASRPTVYLLITCEHGGNRIPAAYRSLFSKHRALLESHRGYDAGALRVATDLATRLRAPLVSSTVSRLVIDLNRSIGHPRLYSEMIRNDSAGTHERILARYYHPYRLRAEQLVARAIEDGDRVVHVSSHSFSPELDGRVRGTDIGLLYDPARSSEVALCERWKASFGSYAPELKVRRNYPYLGKSDGLTAYFRRRFPPDAYAGIELEINQKHVVRADRAWWRLREAISASLREALANSPPEAYTR